MILENYFDLQWAIWLSLRLYRYGLDKFECKLCITFFRKQMIYCTCVSGETNYSLKCNTPNSPRLLYSDVVDHSSYMPSCRFPSLCPTSVYWGHITVWSWIALDPPRPQNGVLCGFLATPKEYTGSQHALCMVKILWMSALCVIGGHITV